MHKELNIYKAENGWLVVPYDLIETRNTVREPLYVARDMDQLLSLVRELIAPPLQGDLTTEGDIKYSSAQEVNLRQPTRTYTCTVCGFYNIPDPDGTGYAAHLQSHNHRERSRESR